MLKLMTLYMRLGVMLKGKRLCSMINFLMMVKTEDRWTYIILMRMIKIYTKSISFLVYSNLFTKLFEREGIDVSNETKKIKMRARNDVYYEKNLRIMHVCKDGVWDFKYPEDRGIPCFVKLATVKSVGKFEKVYYTRCTHTIP